MRFIAAFSLFLCFTIPAHAGIEEGLTAYSAGDYASALGEIRPLAEQGTADAQTYLGEMYSLGHGVEQDNKEAVKWYRKAAEQGFAAGQASLGTMYRDGLGVPQHYKEAMKWYRMAAEQGYFGAQVPLSGMYYNGQGVPQSHVVAYALVNLAAMVGSDTAAQNVREGLAERMSAAEINAGQALSREMFKPGNFTAALQQLRPMEEPVRADAELHLEKLHPWGYGLWQDNEAAVKWLTRAAEPDNVNAQYTVGAIYAQGIGVPQDYQMAVMWFRLAAEQGNVDGQHAIGIMYLYGKGVSEDYKEALTWFTKAAEQGHLDAYLYIGAMAMVGDGDGVSKDYNEAITWFTRAGEKGNAQAQFTLGAIYSRYIGDYWQAAEWYRKAALQGHKSPFALHEIELAPAVWKQSCEKPDRPLSCSIVYRSTFRMPDSFDSPDYKPADDEPPLAFSLWAGFDKGSGEYLITVNMDQSPLSSEQRGESYDYGTMVSFKTGPEINSTGWCVHNAPSRYFPRGNLHCRFSHPDFDIAELIANPDNWSEDDALPIAFSVRDTNIFSFSVPVNEEQFKPQYEHTILDAHRREDERLKVAAQKEQVRLAALAAEERRKYIERKKRADIREVAQAKRKAAERRAERKEREHWNRIYAEEDRRQSKAFWNNVVNSVTPQYSGGGRSSGNTATWRAPSSGGTPSYDPVPTCELPAFQGYDIGSGNGKHGVAVSRGGDQTYDDTHCYPASNSGPAKTGSQ